MTHGVKAPKEPWTRDHRLGAWGVLATFAGVLAAIAAIVVSLVATNSGGSPTIINKVYALPTAGTQVSNGPRIYTNSCPGGASTSTSTSSPSASASALAVDLLVRSYRNGECFARSVTVGQTPSTVEYEISYVNTSNTVQHDVVMSVALAKGLQLVPGSTYLANSNFPQGTKVDSDKIVGGGIIIGTYGPKANAFLAFEAKMPPLSALKCGPDLLRTIAYVQPKGQDSYYNTADINLGRSCPASGG